MNQLPLYQPQELREHEWLLVAVYHVHTLLSRAKVESSVVMISVQCGEGERSVHTQLLLWNVCIACLIFSILLTSQMQNAI